MLIQDRDESRKLFFAVWEKLEQKTLLTPIESIIADVIQLHPEYHTYLSNPSQSMHDDFKPEQGITNPFLHMGMHIAIREQVDSDRPSGIKQIHAILSQKSSAHDAEHKMIECLGESLWEAQRDQSLPDETRYLDCLRKLG